MASSPDANKVVTVSVSASVTGTSSNSIHQGHWVCYSPGGWEYDSTNGDTSVNSSAEAHGTAVPDSRGVTISSNFDITNMKAPQLDANDSPILDENGDVEVHSVPHARESDGTMSGDIGIGWGVEPYPDVAQNQGGTQSVTYQAHTIGDWTVANSSYNWYSSLKQSGDSGPLFNGGDAIPDFGNSYYVASHGPTGGTAAGIIDPGETAKLTIFISLIRMAPMGRLLQRSIT